MSEFEDIINHIIFLVIGLERNYRGLSLELQLRQLGYEVMRVDAIDGNTFEADISEIYNRDKARFFMHRELSNGEVAISLSHEKALEAFLKTDYRFCVILEDDAVLNAPKNCPMEKILEAIESDFTILQLHIPNYSVYSRLLINNFSNPVLLKVPYAPRTTSSYALSRRTAQFILDRSEKVYSVADWPIWSLELKWFMFNYNFFATDNTEKRRSTLEDDRSKVKLNFGPRRFIRLACATFGLRLFKAKSFGFSARHIYLYEVVRPIREKFFQRKRINLFLRTKEKVY